MKAQTVRTGEESARVAPISRRAMIAALMATAAATGLRGPAVAAILLGRGGEALFPPDGLAPRFQHTAVMLGDGNVLVVGGIHKSALNEAILYKPEACGWYSAAPMNTARYNHAAVALSPTTVLVLGGLGTNHQPLNDVEIYDCIADTWTRTSPLQIPRHQHTATRLADGSVFVAGGMFNGILSDFEIYRAIPGSNQSG